MSKKQETPEATENETIGQLVVAKTIDDIKAEFALDGYKTVLIPISTDESGAILAQHFVTVPADKIPEGGIDIGTPAPVQDNGEMVLISNTGGIVRVPAADLTDYPGYARAVAEVHF